MPNLQPLPEHIPFTDKTGIAKRWIGWFRKAHATLDASVDQETLQAFASINQPDLSAVEDQAQLAVFGSESAAAGPAIDELRALTASPSGASFWQDQFDSLDRLLALSPVSRSWSELSIVADTAANASLYPAASVAPGSLRLETDTSKLFMAIADAWVQLIAPALLQFLGTTAAFPALKRSGTILQVRLADDSDYSALEVLDEAYGSGWNGKVEVPTKNAVFDKVAALFPTDPPASAYTPTATNVTNVSASTAINSKYFRIGNLVIVFGLVVVDPAAAGAWELGISIPIASNFAAGEDMGGSAACISANESAGFAADATNKRARLLGTAVDTSSKTWSFIFGYIVQ